MGALKYILAIAVFCSLGFLPSQEYETISWDAAHRLTWNDFKASPPQNDRAAATTASGITYRYSSTISGNRAEVDFNISTHFYPNKSWYQPHLVDSVILSHEQLHFDISELFARKFRKQLSDTRFTKNVKTEVRAIYKQINAELSDFQNRYDDETNFSRNRDQQQIWNEKIAALLE